MPEITFPWETPPETGDTLEVAEGIWWVRVPLPMALDHVNCFIADDGDGWTIIDTGLDSAKIRAIWSALLDGPFSHKPVTRVLITHHHPDHIGLAGWFMARGATLWTTSVAYLTARMLVLDTQDRPAPEAIQLWRLSGMDAEILTQKMGQRPFNFADCVHPLPLGHVALEQDQVIQLAGRRWRVHIGQGHAPDHATLWCEDEDLVIAGDQVLPGISPNVSVYPTAPEADPLAGWIESCTRLLGHANDRHLLLGGHKLPFRGLPFRLNQLLESHHKGLDRLADYIKAPKTAAQCFPVLFKRTIDAGTYGLALGEAYANLAHLRATGRATRDTGEDGAYYWTSQTP